MHSVASLSFSEAPHNKSQGNVAATKSQSVAGPALSAKKARPTSTAEKLRVKLTPIEEFEKKLSFHLTEAPGRVIGRLERWMGSDKVNFLDADWMNTLVSRMEEEQGKQWNKRRKERVRQEYRRYRNLAIEGLMVPDSDMQNIYFHPMYRMNKVLERAEKLDYGALINASRKPPPLTLCEPFEDDESGAVFRTFPGHEYIRRSVMSISTHAIPEDLDELDDEEGEEEEGGSEEEEEEEISTRTHFMYTDPEHDHHDHDHDHDHDHHSSTDSASHAHVGIEAHPPHAHEHPHPIRDRDSFLERNNSVVRVGKSVSVEIREPKDHTKLATEVDNMKAAFDESLVELKSMLPVKTEDELEEWAPFRSVLVKAFDDNIEDPDRVMEEMYSLGAEVTDVYWRETKFAEDEIKNLNRLINKLTMDSGEQRKSHANIHEGTGGPPRPSSDRIAESEDSGSVRGSTSSIAKEKEERKSSVKATSREPSASAAVEGSERASASTAQEERKSAESAEAPERASESAPEEEVKEESAEAEPEEVAAEAEAEEESPEAGEEEAEAEEVEDPARPSAAETEDAPNEESSPRASQNEGENEGEEEDENEGESPP